MKSIEMSAPRACGTADTANASMLNAKKSFFIIREIIVYEAFDFSAPGFIQLLIRKVHLFRACSGGCDPKKAPPSRMARVPRIARTALERTYQKLYRLC